MESRSARAAERRWGGGPAGDPVESLDRYVVMPNSCGQNLRPAEGYDVDGAQPRGPRKSQATAHVELGSEMGWSIRRCAMAVDGL